MRAANLADRQANRQRRPGVPRRSRLLAAIQPRRSIGLKIGAAIGLLVAAALGIHAVLNNAHDRLVEQKKAEAERLGEMIYGIVAREMEAGEPARIQDHLDFVRHLPGVENIRIFDASGALRFALDAAAIGRRFDLATHPDCTGCHTGGGAAAARTSLIRRAGTHRLFQLDYPLRNGQRCQRCHGSGQTMLGNLLLEINLTESDLLALAADRRLMITGGIVFVLITAGAWLLARLLVVRPLRGLVAAAREVERGNFAPKFPAPREDEIGELLLAFQHMTERLGRLVQHQEREIARRTDELRRNQRQAAHQEKMAALGRLTAGVAHEIGNPIASISALVQVLERQSAEPATRRQAREILQQVQRISRIVRELLENFRPGAPEPRPFEVGGTIATALRIARYDRGLRKVEVEIDVAPDCPHPCLVEDQLLQVLLNLILNALDAMPGGGRLRIAARQAAAGLELLVADSGQGIAAEALPLIFDPFFTTKPPGRGTGLGLWVSYSIIRGWQGTVDVTSQVGRGTRVRLVVPVRPVKRAQQEERADAAQSAGHRRRAADRSELAVRS